jgi:hypothetical protein
MKGGRDGGRANAMETCFLIELIKKRIELIKKRIELIQKLLVVVRISALSSPPLQ